MFGVVIQYFFAANQAATKAEIEHADYVMPAQTGNPLFQFADAFAHVGGPHQCTDRAAAYHMGMNAVLCQCADDADMRPTSRCAATERETDNGSSVLARNRRIFVHKCKSNRRGKKIVHVAIGH